MLNPLSAPVIAMAGISFYVGLHHLIIYFRMRLGQRREHLTFALLCFATGFYDAFCAGLYNAGSVPEGAGWQRLQLISLAFFVPVIVTFVSTYTRRRLGWVVKGFYLFYLAAILVQSLDRTSLTIDVAQPAIKNILLPFNLQITYYEATFGPFTLVQSLVGMAASAYAFFCAIAYYRSGHPREAAPLLLAISLMFVAGLNDTLVSNGGYQFVYLIEYGYMAIILLMAYSISNTVGEAGQIQVALQQANLVVENSPVILFRWKAAEGWPVELVSRNVTQFGYTPDELLSGAVLFRDMVHPKDLARVTREVREYTESGAERFTQEYRLLTRDGRIRWTDDRTVIERDRNGKVTHYEGIIIDITERKLAEQAQEQLISELEAKNAELESFTDTASRDLKAPLIEIRRLLRSLEEDVTSGDRALLKEHVEKAARAGERMRGLLDDLLFLSYIGRSRNPPVDVSFGELVSEALGMVDSLRTGKVEIVVAEALPVVRGDRPRLVEVVRNLIDNATRSTDGLPGRRIEIGREGQDMDGNPVFFVRDNGRGISPGDQASIFGLTYRLEENGQSAGVDLAIVKKIIEVHGGRIWVESEMGRGSTFFFTLPLAGK